MRVHDYILLWNQAVIRVMDVRHRVMECTEQLNDYQFPASGFLLTARGSARIWLDGKANMVRRFHVLHSGKGAYLDIEAGEQFEYYLILYKAALPCPVRRDLQLMLERDNPFQQQYAFAPQYPIPLLEKAMQMHSEWRRTGALEKLHAKSLFYQFIHELSWQMQQHGITTTSPNLSEQAIRYMTEHYREAITLEAMAQLLNYSPQYLSRKFKDETGCSPIHFLIRIRMNKAQELLLTTDATLQEVADSVGYPDLFYFNRMFKKYVGIAPGQYRNRKHAGDNIRYSAKSTLISPIEKQGAQRYIANDNENYYQYIRKGDYTVYRSSKASMGAILLLCFTLLLSACGPGGTNTTASPPNGGGNAHQASNGTIVQPAEGSPEGAAQQPDSPRQAATKTVSTPFGNIDIPIKANRIVAVDYLGSLLTLGVTPVGSSDWLMQNPYIQGKLAGVENIGESIEKIMELEPDLIITLSTKQEQYDKYSKIAPTVSVPYDQFHNIHEEVTFFGELLDRQEEASAWEADYDARIAAVKAKVDQAVPQEKTFTVLEDQEKTVYLFGPISGRGGRVVYQSLGRQAPASIPDNILREKYYPLSMELLGDYAGDYIILTLNDKSLEQYKEDPIWGRLDAVQQGRVYIWDETRSWFNDPLATLAQIEELAAWLTEQSQS